MVDVRGWNHKWLCILTFMHAFLNYPLTQIFFIYFIDSSYMHDTPDKIYDLSAQILVPGRHIAQSRLYHVTMLLTIPPVAVPFNVIRGV
jgi:hypothetical protein